MSLKIADAVAGRPFASICDGTTDVAGKEQESLCIRFVDDAGEIQEHFLCVIEPPDTTGKTLAAMIEGALLGMALPSVMRAAKNMTAPPTCQEGTTELRP